MIKNCVVLNGEIINIGDWDYQLQPVEITPAEYDEEGNVTKEAVYEDQAMNPLPEGAAVEERDIVEDPDGGLIEAGTYSDPDVELSDAIEAAIANEPTGSPIRKLGEALLGNGTPARVKGRRK